MSQEMEIRIRPIFSTPLLVFTIPFHERINKELRQAILEREASHPAEADHEVVGWSSPHDMSMFEWAGPALKDLLAPVLEVATQATEFSERAPELTGKHPRWQVVERSEEHTSELQSPCNLVCRLLLEKKKNNRDGGGEITHSRTDLDVWSA